MYARTRNVSLRDLAESGIGNAAPSCDRSPVSLCGFKPIENPAVHCGTHAGDYPHADSLVNPHQDTISPHSSSMATLRNILARNVLDRMRTGPYKTQKQLAKKAAISQSHVSRIVNAESGATIDRLESVADALGCEPYELLLEDDDARRRLIDRLMRGPAIADEHIEKSGYVPIRSEKKRKAKG